MKARELVKGLLLVQLAAASAVYTAETQTPQAGDTSIVDSSEKKMPAGAMRASQLVGVNVYDQQGGHFGEVKDLVLDKNRGQISFAVIDFKGIDTLKDKAVLLPVVMLRYSPSEDRIYVNVDQDAIKGAPNLDAGHWAHQANADYCAKLNDYCQGHVQNMSDKAKTAMKQAAEQGQAMKDETTARPAAGQIPEPAGEGIDPNRKATSWIGRSVQSPAGDDLGSINEIVIDSRNGHVLYAVLSYGGMVGMRDKLYAIPVDAFKLQVGSDKLELNATKDQLKGMPSFDKDKWPAKPEAGWTKTP